MRNEGYFSLGWCRSFALACIVALGLGTVAGCGGGGGDPTLPPAYSGTGLGLLVATDGGSTVSVWPGEKIARRVVLTKAVSGIRAELSLETPSNALQLAQSGDSGTLTVDATSMASGTQTAATVVAKNLDNGTSERLAIVVQVLTPTVVASGSLTSSGGTVSSPGGAIGVQANPGQLSAPVGVTIRTASLSNGVTRIRMQFDRDVSAETGIVTLISNHAAVTNQSGVRELAVSPALKRPLALSTPPYPISTTLGNYPGYFLEFGNYRLANVANSLGALTRWSCGDGQTKSGLCLDLDPSAARLSSSKTNEQLDALRNAAAASGPEVVPVLFVHGYKNEFGSDLGGGEGTWNDFPKLVADLTGDEKVYVPFEFQWRSNASFSVVADELADTLIRIRNLTGRPARIVAHSFGGVLVRTLLQGFAANQTSFNAAYVHSVLTLGAPHSGIFGTTTTVDGQALPVGRDTNLIANCGQVSCYQAGGGLYWGIDPADVKALTAAGVAEGGLIAALANGNLPTGLPFVVGIGLKREDGSNATYDSGDGLISFRGQRFNPTVAENDPLYHCRSAGGGRVKEVVLKNGTQDFLIRPGATATERGYSHIGGSLPASMSPNSEIEYGEPYVTCSAISTCDHASFALFRATLDHPTQHCDELVPVISQVVDDLGAIPVPVAQDATTGDNTPTLSGTLRVALGSGQRVRVFNGAAILGEVPVSGTSWSFTPTALANGRYSFTAAVVSATGIEGNRSTAWSLTIDSTVPPPPAPTVNAIDRPTMDANGVTQDLTIFGANFRSGNLVQFKWTVEPNAGVWNNAKGTVNVPSAGQINATINPGTDRDVIQVRVCRSAAQIADADCSIPQPLTVTPPKAVPGPNLVVQKFTFGPTSFVAGAGGNVQVNFDVVNLGLGTAAGSTGVIRFTQSSQDPAGTNATTFPLPAILAGGRSPVAKSVPAPAAAGTYWVWVIADISGTSGENPVDAANNKAVANTALVVTAPPPPPPVINSFSVIPASPVARALATFRFDGTNLQAGYRFSFPGCVETEVVSTSTTRREFTCTLSQAGSNLAGTLTSAQGQLLHSFTLTVAPFIPPPVIIIEPSDTTVNVGQSATFSVTASDTTTPTGEASQFQWRREGVNIPGATAKSYTTQPTSLADHGATFSVLVSNAGGSAPPSRAATLTVTNTQAGAGYYLVDMAGPFVAGATSPGSLAQAPFTPSLVAMSTQTPGTTKIVEAAGQWSGIPVYANALEGTVNPATRQMTGMRQRFTAYVKGSRIHKVDHVAAVGGPVGQPMSTQPVTEICLLSTPASVQPFTFRVHNDFADAAKSVMVYSLAGADQVCGTPDDSYRAIRFGMTSTDAPLTVPKVLTSIFNSAGGITGFIVQSGSLVQRVDANFQNPVTVPGIGTVSNTFTTGFGATLPGYWIFGEGAAIKAFDLAGLAAPITLFNLAAGEGSGGLAADTSSFYVAINAAASARVLRVDHNLNVATLATLPARVEHFALSTTRVIVATGVNVQAFPTSGGGAITIATAPLPLIEQLIASGENIYVGSRDNPGTARTVRIVRSDGTSTQDINGAVLVQGVSPSPDNFWLTGGTFGVLMAEGWTPANGSSGATLKLYEGATRAQLVSFGSLPGSPPADVQSSATQFLQQGQYGLVRFVPRPVAGAAPTWDLFLFKTDAVGLTRSTNLVTAAQVQSAPLRSSPAAPR